MSWLIIAVQILCAAVVLGAIHHSKRKIMSKITDYVAAVETVFADVSTDLTTISGQATDLKSQVAALQTQLANADLSDTDKAALDQLVTDAGTLASAADTAAGKVATPPAAPTPETPPAT